MKIKANGITKASARDEIASVIGTNFLSILLTKKTNKPPIPIPNKATDNIIKAKWYQKVSENNLLTISSSENIDNETINTPKIYWPAIFLHRQAILDFKLW